MAMSSKDLHLLTHTARMLGAVASNPKHKGGPEYRKQIKAYQHRWSELSKADRAELLKAAESIHDMTEPVLAAAVAALEA